MDETKKVIEKSTGAQQLEKLLKEATAAGKISSKRLIDVLDAVDATEEEAASFYERLEAAGVEIDVGDILEVIGEQDEPAQELEKEPEPVDPEELMDSFPTGDPVHPGAGAGSCQTDERGRYGCPGSDGGGQSAPGGVCC